MNTDAPATVPTPAPATQAGLELLEAARSLATMPGDPPNTEYDRAIVELTAAALGLTNLYADAPELATEMILGRTANR